MSIFTFRDTVSVAYTPFDSRAALNGSLYCVKIIRSKVSSDEIAELAESCRNGKVIISLNLCFKTESKFSEEFLTKSTIYIS